MLLRKSNQRFAACLDNTGYEASLQLNKLYEVVADENQESHGHLRVIDEDGEDYCFAANRFALIDVSVLVAHKLRKNHATDNN